MSDKAVFDILFKSPVMPTVFTDASTIRFRCHPDISGYTPAADRPTLRRPILGQPGEAEIAAAPAIAALLNTVRRAITSSPL